MWYRELFDFGAAPSAGASSANGNAADDDLIPRLFADLVVPLATQAVQASYSIKLKLNLEYYEIEYIF